MLPLRLTVQFRVAQLPLVQVVEARELAGGELRGAGAHAIDLSDPGAQLELIDPATGAGTGAFVSIAHVLAVLHTLARS